MSHGAPADHVTPYDRLGFSETTLIAMLASPEPHEGLVEYFGEKLHADLVKLARASQRPRARPGRRVYLLPGIMGSQLGFIRGGQRPNDIVWLDPIDINFGRLNELSFPGSPKLIALGAMSYTYLKLTLSLRKAGFDAVLVEYDWRRDIESLGLALAERLVADGCENVALVGAQHGRPGRTRRADTSGGRAGLATGDARHAEFRFGGGGAGAARHLLRGAQAGDARPETRRGFPRQQSLLEFSRHPRVAAGRRWRQSPEPVRPGGLAGAGTRTRCGAVARGRRTQRRARTRGCALQSRGGLQSHHRNPRRAARRRFRIRIQHAGRWHRTD